MFKVYLASPLGFSPELKSYRDKIKRRLAESGYTVLDPRDQKFHSMIEKAGLVQDWSTRVRQCTPFGDRAPLLSQCYLNGITQVISDVKSRLGQ